MIDVDTALLRLDANRLEELFKKVIASGGGATAIASGLNASPGAAVGRCVFSADDAQEWAERGEPVILVRRETTPDDYHGMIRSEGILTSAGGTNSHAAVVARGEGIPAVCGADQVRVDRQARKFTVGGTEVAEGDFITIDGFTGKVYAGQLELADSPIERARAGDAEARTEKIWQAYERFMARADEVRRLKVRANADTPGQSANAIERGAEGIGLCRTEHMFLGEERVAAVRTMIFASSARPTSRPPTTPCCRCSATTSSASSRRWTASRSPCGCSTRRCTSSCPTRSSWPWPSPWPPSRARRRWRWAATRPWPWTRPTEMLAKVNDLHETNPMLGLRGVRLGIVKPGLYAMQVRAIIEAAAKVKADGGNPIVEIMIPLAATREELSQLREELEPVARQTLSDAGQELQVLWGTMIELPRAALVAGEIAEVAEFFSFGTNDLTQTAFGFSRDDIGKFLGLYEERKLVPANPFVTVDVPGVGRLMQIACEEGRQTREGLKLGICGEHGGDPDSVRFCHELGLDYVSCSPFRVPTARLAAGQAALGEATAASK